MACRLIRQLIARNGDGVIEIAIPAAIPVEIGLGQRVAAGIGPGLAGGDDTVTASVVAIEDQRHHGVGNRHIADRNVTGVLYRHRVIDSVARRLPGSAVIVIERAGLGNGEFRHGDDRHFLADNHIGKLVARNRRCVVEIIIAAARRIEVALLHAVTSGPAPGLADIKRTIAVEITGHIEGERDKEIAGRHAGQCHVAGVFGGDLVVDRVASGDARSSVIIVENAGLDHIPAGVGILDIDTCRIRCRNRSAAKLPTHRHGIHNRGKGELHLGKRQQDGKHQRRRRLASPAGHARLSLPLPGVRHAALTFVSVQAALTADCRRRTASPHRSW